MVCLRSLTLLIFLRTIHRIPTPVNPAALPLLLVLALLFCATARGQEQKYYNIKAGPVLLTLSSGVSVEYNDNINLSSGISSPIQSDVIVNPHFGISAVSELQFLPKSQTDRTTLGLTLNLGTKRYLQHPELNTDDSGLTVAPDSELSFLVRTGHFRTRLYDRFSLEDDPTADGTLSNVSVFRRFQNNAGVKTTWDMNSKTAFTLGYEHGNMIVLDYATLSGTAPSLSSLDNSTDQVSFSAFSQIFSLLGVGASASAVATNYPDNPGQNMTSYNYGPFMDARLTQYTTLHAAYTLNESRNGNLLDGNNDTMAIGNGSSNQTDGNFVVSVVNHFNRYYTQTVSAGRQTQLNILGDLTVINSVSYNSVWTLNSKLALSSSFVAEDATDESSVNSNPHYKRYLCRFSTGYRLSKKMYSTLSYQYSNKISDSPDQSYKQNMISFNLNYAF